MCYKPSKLGILRGDNDWILFDECCYSCSRATVRSVPATYKTRHKRLVKTVFHCNFASLKNPFQNLILSLVWYIFHFSRNSCITSHKTHCEVRWKINLDTVWQKFIWDLKILWYIKIVFSMWGDAVVFHGIFMWTIALRNFCDQNFLKGNLFKFFWKKVSRGNAVQFFPIFPPKVLVFKR